jgi:hypothetical protein
MHFYELKVSKEVPPSTQEYDAITPAAGNDVLVRLFASGTAVPPNSFIQLVWKFDHATEDEEIIWDVGDGGVMPFKHIIPESEVDGIRQLAILCDNAETGSITMAAYAVIEEF